MCSVYFFSCCAVSCFLRSLPCFFLVSFLSFNICCVQVAVCTGNYAVCLKRQGRYAEALQTFKKALELAERTWGAYDEKTSDILYNIYANFYAQGMYKDAKPYLVRSLEINEKGLGPNHPEVVQSQADLRDLEARMEQMARGT